MKAQENKLDIAIIGGGISGVYSAWRLNQTYGAKKSIALFEYSNRIGGRLYSRKIPGIPNLIAELGAMRYIPDAHVMLQSLITHLGLPTKAFPMGSDIPKDNPVGANNNLFFTRGKYFRYRDFAENPNRIPYNLDWSEQGYSPENLQVKIMNFLCPGFANMTLCEQMKVKVYGKEIWKFGFWDLLYRVISNEGYNFLKDTGGYDGTVSNGNAMAMLPATQYSDETVFLTLTEGFQSLAENLVEDFKEQKAVLPETDRVHLNHRLAEIKYNDCTDYPYTLVFEKTETNESHQTEKLDSSKPIEYQVKQVILAMPRRSLELIKSPFFENDWLKENLKAVSTQPAFKIFMAYERPWWRSLGLVAGRSVTDLPIRQTYYMGTECELEGGEPTMNSLLMASYNDMGSVPFWRGLEGGVPFEGFTPKYLEKDYAESEIVLSSESQISKDMVNIAQRQVEALHNQKDIPMPYSALYHEWGPDPYGGAWHGWKPNYRIDQVMCRMRHPVDKQQIYIIGEAYSYEQGWVEGALNTAESTLEEFFNLSRPVWLKDHPDHNYLPVNCPVGCGDVWQPDDPKIKKCTEILNDATLNAYHAINNTE